MTGKRLFITAVTALLVGLLGAGAASAERPDRDRGAHYVFRGHVTGVSSTSFSLTVEGGNRIALKKMLGQSVSQSFAVGGNTEFLKWSKGVPTIVHATDLTVGDWIVVHVRAERDAELAEIEAKGPSIVSDRGPNPNPPDLPLFLFRGKLTSSSPTAVTVDVHGGNKRALRLLLGQPSQQVFTYNGETIFLLWQGKVPTVISPSQLKLGDRITVRIRAKAGSSLAEVESTPARHIGEHEPPAAKLNS